MTFKKCGEKAQQLEAFTVPLQDQVSVFSIYMIVVSVLFQPLWASDTYAANTNACKQNTSTRRIK